LIILGLFFIYSGIVILAISENYNKINLPILGFVVIFLGICCFSWLAIGISLPYKYTNNYIICEVETTKEGTQFITHHHKFVNLNTLFGRTFKPDTKIKVTTADADYYAGLTGFRENYKYEVIKDE
jgi:hypothetical protein